MVVLTHTLLRPSNDNQALAKVGGVSPEVFAQTMDELQDKMGANHAEGMAMLEHYGEELAAYQESVLAEQQATRAAVTHVVEGVGRALSSKMDDNQKAFLAALQASMAQQEARSNAQTSLILAKVASTNQA